MSHELTERCAEAAYAVFRDELNGQMVPWDKTGPDARDCFLRIAQRVVEVYEEGEQLPA